MSISSQVKEIFTPYKRSEEYRQMLTRWRGLVRTYTNMEDRAAGKPPKKRKSRGNTSGNTSPEEESSP